MKLRYTRQALADLDEARAYIAERNPRAASATVARIRQSIDGLRMFPERGREGRIEGTRASGPGYALRRRLPYRPPARRRAGDLSRRTPLARVIFILTSP